MNTRNTKLPKMQPDITNLKVEQRTKYYSNGQKRCQGSYVSYHPVFNHISWYENGNKKSEGFYKGLHERYGEWKFWHSNGQLACKGIYEGTSKGPGAITFMYGEENDQLITNKESIPIDGDLYMFPYNLRHMVNPHKSNCERVSIGINLTIKGGKHDN